MRSSTPVKTPVSTIERTTQQNGHKTSADRRSPSPAGFKLKGDSLFTKKYTYSVDDKESSRGRPYSPRTYGGFNYTTSTDAPTDNISPITSPNDDLQSPGSRKATGVAFTYNPPGTEIKSPGERGTARTSPLTTSERTQGSALPTTRLEIEEARRAYLRDEKEIASRGRSTTATDLRSDSLSRNTTTSTKESSHMEKSQSVSSRLEKMISEKRAATEKPSTLPLKTKASPRSTNIQSMTLPTASPRLEQPSSGRGSRASNLDSSSESVSSDEGSMVDQYEKEDPRLVAPKVTSTSRAPVSARTDVVRSIPSPSVRTTISPKTPTTPTIQPKPSPTQARPSPTQVRPSPIQSRPSTLTSTSMPAPYKPLTSPSSTYRPLASATTPTSRTTPTTTTTSPPTPPVPTSKPPEIVPPGARLIPPYKRPSPEKEKPVPRFTHMSRKRVVTNADGTVEEMEEVMEPSQLSALSGGRASKPVVVGVVPSATKPELVLLLR